MQAILICKKNESLIAGKLHHSNTRLPSIMKKSTKDKPAYFIANYNSDPTLEMGWATFPQTFLDKYYQYDAEKVKTEFVEITNK